MRIGDAKEMMAGSLLGEKKAWPEILWDVGSEFAMCAAAGTKAWSRLTRPVQQGNIYNTFLRCRD